MRLTNHRQKRLQDRSRGGQVVANEISIIPPGAEHDSKTVDSDLDKGIGNNLDAALIESRLNKGVKYEVKNGVVVLKGEVNSQNSRARAESIIASVISERTAKLLMNWK